MLPPRVVGVRGLVDAGEHHGAGHLVTDLEQQPVRGVPGQDDVHLVGRDVGAGTGAAAQVVAQPRLQGQLGPLALDDLDVLPQVGVHCAAVGDLAEAGLLRRLHRDLRLQPGDHLCLAQGAAQRLRLLRTHPLGPLAEGLPGVLELGVVLLLRQTDELELARPHRHRGEDHGPAPLPDDVTLDRGQPVDLLDQLTGLHVGQPPGHRGEQEGDQADEQRQPHGHPGVGAELAPRHPAGGQAPGAATWPAVLRGHRISSR